MSFSQQTWQRLKNITADEFIAALKRDGWTCDMKGGSMHIFLSRDKQRRVSIHYHPKKTFGPGLLKGLLASTGWTEEDLQRIKLI